MSAQYAANCFLLHLIANLATSECVIGSFRCTCPFEGNSLDCFWSPHQASLTEQLSRFFNLTLFKVNIKICCGLPGTFGGRDCSESMS
jgi:hypothetical protein